MPKFQRRYRPSPDIAAGERFEIALQDEYVSEILKWPRSAKGNLWHRFNSGCVTIFHRDGHYRYCIKEVDESPIYSGNFDSEQDAAIALAEELLLDCHSRIRLQMEGDEVDEEIAWMK